MELKIHSSLLENKIAQPKNAFNLFKSILDMEQENDQMKEHLWAIGLNANQSVLYVELVSLGSLTQTVVHPREVFRLAILKNAYSIIIAHNHPSGNSIPSDEDIELTKKLVKAGEILAVRVLDHIVVGNSHFSFAEADLLK